MYIYMYMYMLNIDHYVLKYLVCIFLKYIWDVWNGWYESCCFFQIYSSARCTYMLLYENVRVYGFILIEYRWILLKLNLYLSCSDCYRMSCSDCYRQLLRLFTHLCISFLSWLYLCSYFLFFSLYLDIDIL
jgi:hypothetical protein